MGIITKARKIVNKETLLTLYYSFIYPYLNYCKHGAVQNYKKRLLD